MASAGGDTADTATVVDTAQAPDAPPDVAVDPPDSATGAVADVATDVAPDASPTVEVAGDAESDAGSAEVADATAVETLPIDAVAEVSTDTGPDAAEETAPDVVADVAPDVSVDATPDAATDAIADVAPDVAPDTAVDVPPDIAPDTAPEVVATCTLNCNDGNPCTADQCANGACLHSALPTCGASPPCNATTPCPGGKVCEVQSHACVACVANADCGAGAWCSQNQCVKASGCKSDSDCKASNQVCDKPMALCVDCLTSADCAANEACQNAQCVPFKACKSSKECPQLCDLTKGVCAVCTSATDCAAEAFCSGGQCLPDVCSKGACIGTVTFDCKSDGSGYSAGQGCDDSNPCTSDACANGACAFTPQSIPCADGNACTGGDTCKNGQCAGGAAITCDDKLPCTKDSCAPDKGCVATVDAGLPCDDGNACTESDGCATGKCAGAAKNCSDSNPCTLDQCDGGACKWVGQDGACNDNNPCTDADACKGGKCQGAAVKCDDNNGCTTDTCDAAKGCLFAANTALCNDASACTDNDACNGGKCSGTPKVCNDGNGCTDDACLAGNCVFANNTVACGAAGSCSACGGGQCVTGAGKSLDVAVASGNDLRTVLPVAGGGYTAVGGTALGGKGGADGWFVKLNAAGIKVSEKVYGTAGDDLLYGHLPAGNGYAMWGRATANNVNVAWLIHSDGDGNPDFNVVYPGANGASTAAYRAVAFGGGWVLAGGTSVGFQSQGWVARTDGAGKQLWAMPLANLISASAVGVFSDGTLAVGGLGTSYQLVIARVSADGAVVATYSAGPASFVAEGVMAAGDSFVVLGAYNNKGPGLAAVDGIGKLSWLKNFTIGSSASSARMALGPNGGCLVSGYFPGSTTDGWLASADNTGTQLWSHLYGGGGADLLYGVTYSGGRILAAGNTGGQTGTATGWVLDLDANGNLGCECQADSGCNDNNPCTSDTCNNGLCKHGNLPTGTLCAGGTCNGSGKCGAPVCGNGTCEPGENIISCAKDRAVVSSHVCDKACGGPFTSSAGSVCYCDAQCKTSGDCCNANATATGKTCAGSTCTVCQ